MVNKAGQCNVLVGGGSKTVPDLFKEEAPKENDKIYK